MSLLLEVRDLRTGFGSNTVLHGVVLDVEQGRTGVLLGLNGAGKSVTLKAISGLQPAWSGSIVFEGRSIEHLEAEDRIRAGIGHVLQAKSVFSTLTVRENLRLGGAMLRNRARFREMEEHMFVIFPRLAERTSQVAGSMSGGEQAMLAVARALMGAPHLLLVDEPSAGLSPIMVSQLGDALRRVRATGTSLLLVEQNVGFGLEMADDVFVLEKGRVVYQHEAYELDRDRIASLLGIGELLGASSEPQPGVRAARLPRRASSKASRKKAAPAEAPSMKRTAAPKRTAPTKERSTS